MFKKEAKELETGVFFLFICKVISEALFGHKLVVSSGVKTGVLLSGHLKAPVVNRDDC